MRGRPLLRSEGGMAGIGVANEQTFEHEIPGSGFLKLFISTQNVNLESMKQNVSPFNSEFKERVVDLEEILAPTQWDSLTVAVTVSPE
jgi:hypothetical protein